MSDLILAKTHDWCGVDKPRLAVVFVHGIATNSHSFDGVLEHLEGLESMQGARLVAFDLLGAGESLQSDELEYNYAEQLEALDNSIKALELGGTPLVLVGHSMGTFIVVRYTNTHKGKVSRLVLVSAPVYTVEDLEDPAMEVAMQSFRDTVRGINEQVVQGKAFNNELKNIVMDRENYANLAKLAVPARMIYGEEDRLIAAHNYPKILEDNAEHLTAVKTTGGHSVSRDKYGEIGKALREALNGK